MPLHPDRRQIIAGIATTALTFTDSAMAAETEASFLVVGDWGRDGASHQRDVAAQMERAAAERQALFTMSVGDNFYDEGVLTVTDKQWQTSFETVYTGPHLQKPWYVALGNHDYGGAPQAQIDYSQRSSRWRMPAHYFSLAGETLGLPDVDLFVIDTTPLVNEYAGRTDRVGDNVRAQDTAAQLAWLDQSLATSKARRKLVFGHHTLFSGGSTHGDTPEMIERVLPILQKHGVTAYINGHDHDLQHIRRAGLDIIATGAGSEVRPVRAIEGTQFCKAESGFTIISATASRLTLAFRNYRGDTLYSAVIGEVLPQMA